MNDNKSKAKYRTTLTRIAKQCQARYSTDERWLLDMSPVTTTKPLYHMAHVHLLDSVESFELLQEQIIFLDCKARLGMDFKSDEREFLVNLFEAMWWGSKLKGYPEAGKLADAYVNGNSGRVQISADVYKNSTVVKTAQDLMKAVIIEHYSKSDQALSLKSTDQIVRTKIAEIRKTKRFNQSIEGEIYANGILKAEESNKRLVYTDNRFYLQASASAAGDGTSRTVKVTWKVENEYDFAPYDERPWDITKLPIVHPGTKNRTPKESQKLLAEIFPEHMKVHGRYLDRLLIPDGLSNHMAKLGRAKEFKYSATWVEVMKLP